MSKPSNPISDWPKCPRCGHAVLALTKRGGMEVRVERRRFAIHKDTRQPSCMLTPEEYGAIAGHFVRIYTGPQRLADVDARYLQDRAAAEREHADGGGESA